MQSGGHYREHPALECIWQRLREKSRDHPYSITRRFRRVPVCLAGGNLAAMLAHHLAASNHTNRPCQNGSGGQRRSMKCAVQAGLRLSTSRRAHRTLLAGLLIALGTIGALPDSASAQTAFTLPEDNQSGSALSVGTGNTTNTTQATLTGSAVIYCNTTAVTYGFGYSTTVGSMQYELHIKVESL